MPFTFSHPAIVLPLTALPSRWFSLTGLAAGSLTPDFEYFMRMRMAGETGHTLVGLFIFDLPVGLALTLLFHNIVRDSLFANLPQPIASRLAPFTGFDWNKRLLSAWPVVMMSLLVGAASHLFWDAFTHRDGYFVQNMPSLALSTTILTVDIETYRILQHTSSLLGGLAILYAIFRLPKTRTETRADARYWLCVAAIAVIAISIRISTGDAYQSIGNITVILLSSGMLGLIITPVILRNVTARTIGLDND